MGEMKRKWKLLEWVFKGIEYGVYGDLILMHPMPYSMYVRGTISFGFLIADTF